MTEERLNQITHPGPLEAELLAEVRRLQDKIRDLRDYVEHDAGCYECYSASERARAHWIGPKQCTCGLDEALNG